MPGSEPSIVMIGGHSATGKSTLARALAARLQVDYLDLDLFYVAFRRVVPTERAPVGLHNQDEAYWAKPAEDLAVNYRIVQDYMCNALETVVARYHQKGDSVVMEGAWLTPAFARQGTYAGVETGNTVRAIFLYEPNTNEVVRRRRERADPWTRVFADRVLENISSLRAILS